MRSAGLIRRHRSGAFVVLALALVGAGAETLPSGVAPSAEAIRPLDVGAKSPEIELRDVDGRPVALAGLLSKGPIALVFYRGGW